MVSVLDLDNIAAPEDPASPRHSGGPAILMCALNDVKDIRKDRMTGAAKKADPMTRSRKKETGKTGTQGSGGAYRDRTDDLLNANQALSQLS